MAEGTGPAIESEAAADAGDARLIRDVGFGH